MRPENFKNLPSEKNPGRSAVCRPIFFLPKTEQLHDMSSRGNKQQAPLYFRPPCHHRPSRIASSPSSPRRLLRPTPLGRCARARPVIGELPGSAGAITNHEIASSRAKCEMPPRPLIRRRRIGSAHSSPRVVPSVTPEAASGRRAIGRRGVRRVLSLPFAACAGSTIPGIVRRRAQALRRRGPPDRGRCVKDLIVSR